MELEDLEKALKREAEHYKKKFLFEIQAHGILNPDIWRFALKFTCILTYNSHDVLLPRNSALYLA